MMATPEAVSISVAAAVAVLAAVLLLYARRLVRRARAQRDAAVGENARLTEHQQRLDEEMGHLASVRLPAVLEDVAPGEAPGLRHSSLASTAFAAQQRALLERVAAAVRAERTQADSARSAFLVMADRIQVMALAQQQDLDELERTTEDPQLMAGLMRADHATAQLARQAQTMTVLCGAWPGRQWPSAVSLHDVVRGAQSRVLEYQRVQVQGSRELSVEAPVVEALIHAVAELLDNAVRYSPPTVAVLVAIRPVHSGAVIEIDDGGLGMTEQALAEAEIRLSGDREAEGRGMGGSPQLGLAAVGRLASRYRFSVKLNSPSAYGGVRAVVLVPSALLADAPQAPATPAPPRAPAVPGVVAAQPRVSAAAAGAEPVRGSAPAERSAASALAASAEPAPKEPEAPAQPLEVSAEGLPQRRSRRRDSAAGSRAGGAGVRTGNVRRVSERRTRPRGRRTRRRR